MSDGGDPIDTGTGGEGGEGVQNQAPALDLSGHDWSTVATALAGDNADLAGELTKYEGFDKFLEAKSQPAEFDWRQALAGDDEKLKGMFEQYKEPGQAGKAFANLRNLVGQKNGATIPGPDATDAQIRDFKQAHGIPENVKGYENLPQPPEGMEVSDVDQAFLAKITEKLHGSGALQAHPDIVATSHQLYYDMIEEREALMNATAQQRAEETIALRKQTEGSEMNANTSMAKAAISQFFDVSDPDDIFNIQLADGSFLGAHPKFVNGAISMGRYMMGDPVLAKSLNFDGGNAEGLQARYDELMGMRQTDMKKYETPEVQDELRNLKAMLRRSNQKAA